MGAINQPDETSPDLKAIDNLFCGEPRTSNTANTAKSN